MIVAATGHRPDKLMGYTRAAHKARVALAKIMIRKLQPEKIISGMALGWDQAWAVAGIKLDIPVVAAIPFEGQESKWPPESRKLFSKIVKHCEEQVVVCTGAYAPWKMQVRNKWMVNHCDLLCALWDGSTGGTANCVRYAESVNRKYVNAWSEWASLLQRLKQRDYEWT